MANGNNYFGDDCSGYVKTLTVIYSFNGVQGTNAMTEKQGTMTIGDGVHSLTIISATWGASELHLGKRHGDCAEHGHCFTTMVGTNTVSDGTLQSR